jgi:hypothetical protein
MSNRLTELRNYSARLHILAKQVRRSDIDCGVRVHLVFSAALRGPLRPSALKSINRRRERRGPQRAQRVFKTRAAAMRRRCRVPVIVH